MAAASSKYGMRSAGLSRSICHPNLSRLLASSGRPVAGCSLAALRFSAIVSSVTGSVLMGGSLLLLGWWLGRLWRLDAAQHHAHCPVLLPAEPDVVGEGAD